MTVVREEPRRLGCPRRAALDRRAVLRATARGEGVEVFVAFCRACGDEEEHRYHVPIPPMYTEAADLRSEIQGQPIYDLGFATEMTCIILNIASFAVVLVCGRPLAKQHRPALSTALPNARMLELERRSAHIVRGVSKSPLEIIPPLEPAADVVLRPPVAVAARLRRHLARDAEPPVPAPCGRRRASAARRRRRAG